MHQAYSFRVDSAALVVLALRGKQPSAEGHLRRAPRMNSRGAGGWPLLAVLLAFLPCSQSCSSHHGSSSKRFRVVKTFPADGAEGVAPNQPIEVTFSQAVGPDTVTADTFTVEGATTGRMGGTYAYSSKNKVVTFYPSASYRLGETLQVHLTGGILTRNRQPLEAVNFSFKVKVADSPPFLVGVDVNPSLLWSIDSATGAGAPIGPTGYESVMGLEYDAENDVLYGVDSKMVPRGGSTLLRLDPGTAQAVPVGDIGHDGVVGLAFDSAQDLLYGVTQGGGLLRIDASTGVGTTVGPTGAAFLECLAYDPETALLYAVGGPSDTLYKIDPQTGAGTPIGPVGFGSVSALAMDAGSRKLYGTSRYSGELITMDPATGKGTKVGMLPGSTFQGLAVRGGAPLERFKRGEVAGDLTFNITDAIVLLNYLFANGRGPACMDAADANDDGTLSIDDATRILGYLFKGEGPLPAPFPECGMDPTVDALGCASFAGCG